jgi:uncharacterized protein (DUF2267 family)
MWKMVRAYFRNPTIGRPIHICSNSPDSHLFRCDYVEDRLAGFARMQDFVSREFPSKRENQFACYMTYDHFINQVQQRAQLGSHGDAVAAVRATLETVAERLGGGETKDLASQLPREIGYYLLGGFPELSERFGFQEFIWRVSQRECVDLPKAAYHARVVMEVVGEAVSRGEMEDVFQQLPPEFAPLFAGSTGNIRNRRRTMRDQDEGYRGQRFQNQGGQGGRGREDWRGRERPYQGQGGMRPGGQWGPEQRRDRGENRSENQGGVNKELTPAAATVSRATAREGRAAIAANKARAVAKTGAGAQGATGRKAATGASRVTAKATFALNAVIARKIQVIANRDANGMKAAAKNGAARVKTGVVVRINGARKGVVTPGKERADLKAAVVVMNRAGDRKNMAAREAQDGLAREAMPRVRTTATRVIPSKDTVVRRTGATPNAVCRKSAASKVKLRKIAAVTDVVASAGCDVRSRAAHAASDITRNGDCDDCTNL